MTKENQNVEQQPTEVPATRPMTVQEQIQHLADSAEAFKSSADQAHAQLSQVRADHALVASRLQKSASLINAQAQELDGLKAEVADLQARLAVAQTTQSLAGGKKKGAAKG